ncbi:MAG: hypothetical protein J6X44_01375, partial [Thermoguttaceae bacterium]|nr:hypothetical protein [Thermoguttaceae bacterium]
WPKCPRCGRRRITRCPICKTSGNLFPLGDSAFWNARADETAPTEPIKTCCGSCSNRHDDALYNEGEKTATMDGQIFPGVPSPRSLDKAREKTSDVFDDLPDERVRVNSWNEARDARSSEDSDPNEAPIVVCGVCSEAFEPKFPKRCEWCDYEFETGVEDDLADSDADVNGVNDFLARKKDAPNEDDEANNARVVATVVVIAAILLGGLIYMALL